MSPPVAIRPRAEPIRALVRPPGSKSLTNRALVTAALARGVSRLAGPLEADDTEAMREGLRALGVSIEDNDDPWLVVGTKGELVGGQVNARQSGTTARFLMAVATLARGPVAISGSGRLPERPLTELIDALAELGASASSRSLPLSIQGPGSLRGGRVRVDPSRSSQFVTALLLIAPMAQSELEIELSRPPVSSSYIESTVRVMSDFGATVRVEEGIFAVAPTGYEAVEYQIEADASAAAYPLVAAAITGGEVTILGIPEGSVQSDLAIARALAAMGGELTHGSERLTLQVPGQLEAIDIDMERAPDAVLALAVACLFARGTSRLRGVGNLVFKESDRLTALCAEIARVGGRAWTENDELLIEGGRRLHPAVIDSHGDHRMAMAMALVGLRQSGIEIAAPEVVSKTWPGYFRMLERL